MHGLNELVRLLGVLLVRKSKWRRCRHGSDYVVKWWSCIL